MKKIIILSLAVFALAASLCIVASAENLVDQEFASTTGTLNWAYFETDGTLEYNGASYDAGTVVIYGDGTKFAYSTAIKYNDQSGFPWYDFMTSVTAVVFDTPNLTKMPNSAFAYMRQLQTVYLPAQITDLAANCYAIFAGDWALHTIKAVGVDYSEYGDAHIYDLRHAKTIDADALSGVGRDVTGDVAVLMGGDTTCKTPKFASTSKAIFTFYVHKGSNGETLAKYLETNASTSSNIADNIIVTPYDNFIDKIFTTPIDGSLKWAFFESAGSVNGKSYDAGTLVVYGDGKQFTGIPWECLKESVVKKVVIDAPNLTKIQSKAFSGMRVLEEIVLPAKLTALDSTTSYAMFLGNWALHTIKVDGVDYSGCGDAHVYDLRNIKKIDGYTFDGTAKNVTGDITVFVGENTTWFETTNRFAGTSNANFTLVAYKNSTGETFAQYLETNKTTSNVADNITLTYYPEIANALTFDGFQVRTKGYNGLRCLFTFDNTVANTGATCLEYGAILASVDNKDLYGTELKLVNGEYVTAHSKIVKKAINQNGSFVNKVVTYDENKVTFCTALVNFTNNWKSDLYVCGYEIWEDTYGNISVIYTDVYDSDDNLYTPSIYDAVLLAYTKGVVNAADEDENNVLWEVLDNCRDEITTTPSTSTYTVENNVIKHASANISIHLFTATDVSDVAIITGEGILQDVTKMLKAVALKPVTVVIDHGFTRLNNNCFEPAAATDAKIATIVYPDSLVYIGYTCFQRLETLETMFKVGTTAEVGTIDLSHLEKVALQYLFNGNKPKIKYIHLPAGLVDNSYQGAALTTVSAKAFANCKALKAVWCGDQPKPADGTADFSGTSVTKVTTGSNNSFLNATYITTILDKDGNKIN